MSDKFYNYQNERTLQNLASENTRLKKEIRKYQDETARIKTILDFHDKLERDFFSADSLENLIIKLINCFQIRPDIDFVSISLCKQYLEKMLGTPGKDQFSQKIGLPRELSYLCIIDEQDLIDRLGKSEKTHFRKTVSGSKDIFFHEHGEEVRSQSIIPLILRRQIIGSLNVGSIMSRHYYNQAMGPDLLNRLSTKLAIAIDNILSHKKLAFQKGILDRDINRAAILQRKMLPASLMQTETLEISSFFRPCQKLGGDFYDVIRLSPEKVAIIIADVSGHGISAALIAAMLKFSLQMDHIEKFTPYEMIMKINQRFCQILKNGDYITLCYGIIDTGRSIMNLVRAGHPYPILYRSHSKDSVALNPYGPPVGIDKEATYENMEVKLNSGDMIFLYTDGLTSAVCNKDQPIDMNRLIRHLGKKTGNSSLLETFNSEIKRLSEENEIEDDTSLLILVIK